MTMLKRLTSIIAFALVALAVSPGWADEYSNTIAIFKNAGESGNFFKTAYGYAVFPTIVKGGFIIGGAHGDGRVYAKGRYVGDSSMTQASVGFQIGAQGYSEIIFFQDKRAFLEFTGGNFEFGADAQVVVVTASAQAGTSTTGSSAGASASNKDATTAGGYYKGMATFTVTKGGLMGGVAVGGQKFSYKPV
jgi:lipid-binding SYLF domain-containing protein